MEEFLLKVLRFIFKRKPRSRKKLISHILLYALDQKYDYIIFSCSDEAKFCQFGIKNQDLWMDIPTTPYNYLFPYMKRARKLLEDLNFTFAEGPVSYMKYKYNEEKDIYSINAGFGINADLAADFIIKLFKDIYKDDLSKLKIQLSE